MNKDMKGLGEVACIELAHQPMLRLGRLTIRPDLRQLIDADGAQETLEPRVMQVLVALVRAQGQVVTRDALIDSCWDGRIVGEDAINRVMSRLRRVAQGIGAGAFRIETITKVGYRLIELAEPLPAPPGEAAGETAAAGEAPDRGRRGLLAGAALLGVLALGAGYFVRAEDPRAAELRLLLEEGGDALTQADADGGAQALGLFRRAVALAPDSADAWALLAIASYGQANSRSGAAADRLRASAGEALARARAIDPGDVHVAHAYASMLPKLGAWAEADRRYRAALARFPADERLLFGYGARLLMTGRMRSGAALIDRAAAIAKPSPGYAFNHVQALWSAYRLAEAEAAMDAAWRLFPLHYAVWFTRFFLLLYTGRAEAALAMSGDLEARPRGIPPANFELIELVARAMISRAPAEIDRAVAANRAAAATGAGFAENAMQFAAALGRVDEAFAIAEAYFFGRGFRVGERRFSEMQGAFTRPVDRRTLDLFKPSTEAMRRDPRFERLVEEIGLAGYWRRAGVTPDYRAG